MFGLLADQGVGSIPWSPLAEGYARPLGRADQTRAATPTTSPRWVLPNDDKAIADAVPEGRRTARRADGSIALAWVLRDPVVSAPSSAPRNSGTSPTPRPPSTSPSATTRSRALEEHYTPRQPTGY